MTPTENKYEKCTLCEGSGLCRCVVCFNSGDECKECNNSGRMSCYKCNCKGKIPELYIEGIPATPDEVLAYMKGIEAGQASKEVKAEGFERCWERYKDKTETNSGKITHIYPREYQEQFKDFYAFGFIRGQKTQLRHDIRVLEALKEEYKIGEWRDNPKISALEKAISALKEGGKE